ncbi:hypothetical protein Ga0100231_008470 [Opitutaceae bacterium TAV4]|uniref:hypothetical protein n=1 Tax=Geminisphaera colitermitum TaxID=1148786 RepID=UPI000FF7D8F6|nr:hypothetical protein [Geminisphaera colitermitum]RRJ94388.1 hypothetical protein Ga0100231_008470 [Opitutaceae bacterium TAV4]
MTHKTAATGLLLALATLPLATLSATPFVDADFETATVGESITGWSTTLVTALDPKNPENQVASTATGANTTIRATNALPGVQTATGGISLALDFYIGNAPTGWNTSWYLQSGTLASGQFYTAGYGFVLRGTSTEIYSTYGGGTSTNQGGITSLNGAAVPHPENFSYKTDAWNSLTFTWLAGGSLELRINGSLVATAIDTAAEDATSFAFRTLKLSVYRSTPATETLSFDNIVVAAVPVPEISASVLLIAVASSLLALAATIGKRRRDNAR